MALVSRATSVHFATQAVANTAETAVKWSHPIKLGGVMNFDPKMLDADENRGSRAGDYNLQQGTVDYKGKYSGVYYSDITPGIFRSAMGSDTVSQPDAGGNPLVYQHLLKVHNTAPIGLTIFENIYQATNKTWVYSDAYVNKLGVKLNIPSAGNAGLLNWDADMIALHRTQPTAAQPTAVYPSLKPIEAWRVGVTLNGSNYTYLQTFEFDIDNGHKPFDSSTGTQESSQMEFGEFKCNVKCDILAAETEANYWINNTELPLVVTMTSNQVISGTYYHAVTFTFPKIHFTKMPYDTGKNLVMLKGEGVGLYDSSSGGPLTIMCQTTRNSTFF